MTWPTASDGVESNVPLARAVTRRSPWRQASTERASERALKSPSIAFVARDNFVNRRAIEKAFLVAIGRARQEILLANPYFMPGRKLRRAIESRYGARMRTIRAP